MGLMGWTDCGYRDERVIYKSSDGVRDWKEVEMDKDLALVVDLE